MANKNFSNDLASPPNAVPPLPVTTPSGWRLAAFTDRDVIIVKKSSLSRGRIMPFESGDLQSHTYAAKLTVPVSGAMVSVPRGWSSADVTVRGRTFTFMNTHFEAYGVRRRCRTRFATRRPWNSPASSRTGTTRWSWSVT